jgi:hypothetical protein
MIILEVYFFQEGKKVYHSRTYCCHLGCDTMFWVTIPRCGLLYRAGLDNALEYGKIFNAIF